MATQPYRQNPTLNDVLLSGGNGAVPPRAPVADTVATDSPGTLSQVQRQSLIDALTQPDNLGPEPTVDKRSIGAEIFAGLGDALGAYASGMGAGHGTNFYNEYLARRDNQKQNREQFLKQQALLQSKSKQQKAEFLLSEDNRAAAKADAKIQAEQDRIARKAEKDQADALETAKLAQDQAQFNDQLAWKKKSEELSNTKDLAVARIHAAAAGGDEHAKFDQKKLPEIMGYIGELADSAQTALAGGDPAAKIPGMTKDVMTNRVRRLIEGSGLSPDAKKAVYAFAENELGGEFRNFEANQAAQAQQGTTVEGQPALSPADQAIGGAIGAIPGVLKNAINPYPQKR